MGETWIFALKLVLSLRPILVVSADGLPSTHVLVLHSSDYWRRVFSARSWVVGTDLDQDTLVALFGVLGDKIIWANILWPLPAYLCAGRFGFCGRIPSHHYGLLEKISFLECSPGF